MLSAFVHRSVSFLSGNSLWCCPLRSHARFDLLDNFLHSLSYQFLNFLNVSFTRYRKIYGWDLESILRIRDWKRFEPIEKGFQIANMCIYSTSQKYSENCHQERNCFPFLQRFYYYLNINYCIAVLNFYLNSKLSVSFKRTYVKTFNLKIR